MQPRVSIGLPVYNGANFLEGALDSILSQEFDDFELIISDNGSTDATPGIYTRYAERDARIRIHRFEKNLGAAANYNKTFELAQGEFFKWAAHDDVLAPSFLKRCIETFDASDASVVLVYPRTRFIDDAGEAIRDDTDCLATSARRPSARLRYMINKLNMANPVFGLIRTEALRHTRLIDRFEASDYVLLVELALLGKIVEIPEHLYFRRLHEKRSRQANLTKRDVAQWFDVNAEAPRLSPRMRLITEYIRSTLRMPIPVTEKMLGAASVIPVYTLRRARVIGGRWKRRILKRKQESPAPESP